MYRKIKESMRTPRNQHLLLVSQEPRSNAQILEGLIIDLQISPQYDRGQDDPPIQFTRALIAASRSRDDEARGILYALSKTHENYNPMQHFGQVRRTNGAVDRILPRIIHIARDAYPREIYEMNIVWESLKRAPAF